MMQRSGGPASDEATATIHVADERALADFATRLLAVLPPTAFVALSGDLGAGKTTFVKHVAAAAGIDPTIVVSPTFGLIHHYESDEATPATRPLRIVHADMYRLVGVDDLAETGWADAIATATAVFVEWPERIAEALPDDRIDLAIRIDSVTSRTLILRGHGPEHAQAVAGLASS